MKIQARCAWLFDRCSASRVQAQRQVIRSAHPVPMRLLPALSAGAMPGMFRLMGMFIACCAVAFVTALASEPRPTIVTVWGLVLDKNQLLPAVVLAEQLLEQKSISAQEFAQVYALTGDAKGTASILDRRTSKRAPAPSSELTGYSPEPAISAIVEAARSRRIVMLNESHQDQRHRAFALRLARELRRIGYTHLGAETFSVQINESMEDGAPDGNSGVYTADPLFGDFVRRSQQLGYQLFPYEQRPNQRPAGDNGQMLGLASREQAQAENVRAILEANHNAKIFIYAGGSHIMEHPDSDGNEWMALRLKRSTGQDPLTINQTAGTPRSTAALDAPQYRSVASAFVLTTETVLRDDKGNFLSQPGYDLAVFHPRDAKPTARPGWLSMEGYRQAHEIELPTPKARMMVRAFLADEPTGSIPMDQMLIPPGTDRVVLMLPRGEYRIDAQSESGETVVLGYLREDKYLRANPKETRDRR